MAAEQKGGQGWG